MNKKELKAEYKKQLMIFKLGLKVKINECNNLDKLAKIERILR